ncbi:unnamed protein product, partial [Hydatigera taeniaeformis]|uniref:UBIQUITIN_CONJUGAT_2 domain-containing protein n=1 Tax=Hydatigena taeniaeformis TaxID=6205 RepID=A0A0R3WSQ5_HYDTA
MTAPTAQRTFMKDVIELYRVIDSSTDGQASVIGIDGMRVTVSLRPKSGCNAHAEFLITVKVFHTSHCTFINGSPLYPRISPNVTVNTPIYHPNIDPHSGSPCISILSDWRSCYSLLDLVKAFLYLIDHPIFDSPSHPFGVPLDNVHLAKKSARLLAGLPVNGLRYPPNS